MSSLESRARLGVLLFSVCFSGSVSIARGRREPPGMRVCRYYSNIAAGDFTPEAVLTLPRLGGARRAAFMLAEKPKPEAVCARRHPTGPNGVDAGGQRVNDEGPPWSWSWSLSWSWSWRLGSDQTPDSCRLFTPSGVHLRSEPRPLPLGGLRPHTKHTHSQTTLKKRKKNLSCGNV